MISLIAAIGKNNELGKNNTLVWNMPTDLKFFRQKTSGHPVIMGRKTFASVGRPMPNRRNIIITRDLNYQKDGIEVVHSLKEALDLVPHENEEIFIIGGEEIFKQSMSLADRLYITHIEAEDKDANVFFPAIGPEWKEIFREEHQKDAENTYNFTFSTYERI